MLTVKKIEALIKAGVTREVPDGSVRGLYFAPVSKAWRLRYRHRGKPRSYTLDGRWPELGLALAREIATGLRADIVRGGDPAVEKQTAKAAVTEPSDQDLVERVGEQFILRHIRATMKASWAHEAERMVRKEIIGAWKGRRLSEIGRAEIHDLLDTIVDRPAPVLAETPPALAKLKNATIAKTAAIGCHIDMRIKGHRAGAATRRERRKEGIAPALRPGGNEGRTN